MAFRSALSFAILAIAIAVPVEYHHDAPAEYEFSYAVHDDHTGDIKSHQESRKGHAVTGKYDLIDSDGYKRVVEYTADEHTGFNVIVHREPTDIKIPIFGSHQSHAPVHHYIQSADRSAHLEHHVPVQHQYVAPKIVTKVGKPIIKVSPIVEEHKPVPQIKYVTSVLAKSNLNTHVSYNAPEFNYHFQPFHNAF